MNREKVAQHTANRVQNVDNYATSYRIYTLRLGFAYDPNVSHAPSDWHRAKTDGGYKNVEYFKCHRGISGISANM